MRVLAGIIVFIFLYQAGFAKEQNIQALNLNETEQTENVVTGRVTDLATGQPLVGVTVVVQGTTTGVATDIDGRFSLKVNDPDSKLIFSYIGYETQVIAFSGKTKIDVKLKEDVKVLDEVVAVGYGIVKKKDVTGSIVQVKADDLENIASTQIATALQGKVSGVYIMNNSGQAGAGVDIQIRGITSMNNVSPLWVIDGVPGDQSMVNMNDIETIDIIKDGAAAAIYGVKAAAGVVLVTTKRGIGQKKPKISFNAYAGTSRAWRLPEMVNSDEYITLKNEQWSNKTLPVGFSLDSLGKYETTDWMEEMFKTGVTQNYDLTVSGSNETTNYYLGGSYYTEAPSFVDNSLDRYSVRINSDYKIAKWLKVGESLSMVYSVLDGINFEWGYLDGIFRTPPMMPVYDENNQPGGFGYVDYKALGDYDGENPMANQLTTQGLSYHQKVSGNAFATATILPGLTVTGTFSGDISVDDSKTVSYPYRLADKKDRSTTDISLAFSKGISLLGNVYANYNKEFGEHSIEATAGYEASKYEGNNLSGNGKNAKFGLEVLNQTDVEGRTTNGSEWLGRSVSQFGQLTYKYGGKYVLKGIVRRDGSDKFGTNNRYGVFPSVSAAWKMSEENFMKNIENISFLKLRGGYGINGNDNIGQFLYTSYMVGSMPYPYGNFTTVKQNSGVRLSSSFSNPNIMWERSKHLDLAVELGMFKNALFINAEIYKKSSDQMLFYQSLPLSSGLGGQYDDYPSQVINAGLISNKGLDFSVTYKGAIGDFKYAVNGNFSTFKYRVEELTDNEALMTAAVLADRIDVSRTTVGDVGGYFYGYKCAGIFQTPEQVAEYNELARKRAKELNPDISDSNLALVYYSKPNTAPGDLIYVDIDNDGTITQADRTKIGNPWPKATYGLQVSATYKIFDFSIASSGIYKRDVFNASRASMYQFASYDYSTTTKALTRWTEENPSTTNFRINGDDPNKNMSNPSSWYVEDGSFFRIKNIELGVTIPRNLTEKIGLERLRVYVSGQNIFTFTDYTGFDPEFGIGSATSAGVDGGTYPQSRIFLMGVQVDI